MSPERQNPDAGDGGTPQEGGKLPKNEDANGA